MAQNEEGVVESTILTLTTNVLSEILSNPLNIILVIICLYILYKIFSNSKPDVTESNPIPVLPPLKKHDMTYQELKQYDGTNDEGRVCVAVCGKVFDVTRGKHFYGPGGPYAAFAGKDATRCLATFSVEDAKDDYDDLSDLNSMQMDSAKEWETQFQERYHYVGRLLKPGEEPTDYSDEEEPSQDQSTLKSQSSPSSSSKKDE